MNLRFRPDRKAARVLIRVDNEEPVSIDPTKALEWSMQLYRAARDALIPHVDDFTTETKRESDPAAVARYEARQAAYEAGKPMKEWPPL